MRQQFGQIQIPPAVLDELKIDEKRPGSQPIKAAIAAGWIQVQSVSNQPLVQLLRQTLDGGEAEAIALALELQAEWTIIEDLTQKAGFRIAPELLAKVLQASGAGETTNLILSAIALEDSQRSL